MNVKFLNLKKQYLSIQDEIDSAIKEVLMDSAFAGGKYVEQFEKNFAKKHNATYCVAVNSGTAALHSVMIALDISLGDEVIVPANTFFATPEAVSLNFATPVFVDCEDEFYNIDPKKIENVITKKTKAIIAVHLYGQPAQLSIVKEIAKKNKIFLIEDCAQAHLAEYKNQSVGTFGICGCFSFYCGKNLGAYGEGGAIITSNKRFYEKLILIREHGMSPKYYHKIIGHNYRMAGIQGAVLDVKLKYLEKWTEKRRMNSELYHKYLSNCDQIILPKEVKDGKHVYHLFVIRTKMRNELMNYLLENNIESMIHYPIPCHLQEAYSFLNYKKGTFPNSETIASEIISLPMSEQISSKEIEYICETIKDYFHSN